MGIPGSGPPRGRPNAGVEADTMSGLVPQPITLTGQVVSLEPLSMEHVDALLDAAQSEEIWLHTLDKPRTMEAMQDYIVRALGEQSNKTAIRLTRSSEHRRVRPVRPRGSRGGRRVYLLPGARPWRPVTWLRRVPPSVRAGSHGRGHLDRRPPPAYPRATQRPPCPNLRSAPALRSAEIAISPPVTWTSR